MSTTTLDGALVADLAGRVSGSVLGPQDAGYDEARRVHNGLIDRRPALIVRCRERRRRRRRRSRSRATRASSSPSAAAATTSPAAPSTDGARDDRPLRDEGRSQVDPEARTAARRRRRHLGASSTTRRPSTGSPSTGGAISTTGIAGLTLGGGLGWLMAKYGLAADNLLAVELVTADGEVARGDRRRRIPISSGRCAAAAATSASPRRSRTACTRWRWSRAA